MVLSAAALLLDCSQAFVCAFVGAFYSLPGMLVLSVYKAFCSWAACCYSSPVTELSDVSLRACAHCASPPLALVGYCKLQNGRRQLCTPRSLSQPVFLPMAFPTVLR